MALLAKIGWRILQHPEALWVQVLKGLYFPNCDFLSATKGSRASWAWSSILEGRMLLQNHVMWQVLNGESIGTWKDRWIPGILSGKLGASHLVAHENDPYQRVADLIDWSTTSWNLDPIARHLSHEEIVVIESIPLSSTWEPDKLIWPFERNGAYSVRSGYHLQHQVRSKPSLQSTHSSHIVNPAVWKQLWNCSTLPKVKHFIWRACTNSLPSMANLYARKVASSPMCPICLDHMETVEHLLLQCPWTAGVWFGLPINYKVDLASISTFDNWFNGVCELMKKHKNSRMALSCWVSFALWIIWKERCSAVYEHKEPNPWGVIARITSAVIEYNWPLDNVSNGVSVINPNTEGPDGSWCAPEGVEVKINCDGAWDSGTKRAGIGVIVRNADGVVINGIMKSCYASSALHSEALAILEGLILAKNLELHDVCVELDSEQLFSAIVTSPSVNIWSIYPLLRDIRKLKLERPMWRWSIVKRTRNAAADWLAGQAKMGLDLGSTLIGEGAEV